MIICKVKRIQKREKLYRVYELLKVEADNRNSFDELSKDKPDPLLIAKKYNDEYISLICALFAYGNAKLIVKFLDSLNFSLLKKGENSIRDGFKDRYYRFQSNQDVVEFMITMKRFKSLKSVESIFKMGYCKSKNIVDGLREVISFIYDINPYR